MSYNPALGNFVFSDEQLDRERDRMALPKNSMDPEERHAIQVMFCQLLAKGNTIHKSVQTINGSDDYAWGDHQRVSRKTIYMWRKFDEVFREAWDAAYQAGTELLEQKASEVAFEGNPTLLIHMLKMRNHQRHGINKTEISGPGGSPISVNQIELIGVDAADGEEVPDEQSSGTPSS